MAAFERLAHRVHIADAFETVVGAAVRELDEMADDIALDLLRVHEMRHAELPCEAFARGIDVDADDLVRARNARALNDIEADAA
jgi:hypothetical protein